LTARIENRYAQAHMAEGDSLFARFGRTFQPGEVLFREDEPGDTMFVIQSGQVRISKAARDGVKTLAVLGAGEFFGEMAILNSKPRNATADALTELRVLVIDAKTFGQMVVSNAEIAVRLIRKLARRLDSANALIDVLMHRDPKARVILGLSRQAEMIGRALPDGSVLVPISRTELAAEIGLTEEETDDVMARLRRLKIVDARPDGYVVSDVNRLAEFLEFLEMRDKFGDA
jgi:CRP/FNR family cyclic AMP-dependent transcriptional regulator